MAAGKASVPGEIRLGARFGGVGNKAREVRELRVRWI